MKCRICGNQKSNTIYEAREMMFGMRDTFAYFQCGACLCLQIAEFPINLSKYYPEEYHSFKSASEVAAYFSGFRWKLKKIKYTAALLPDSLIDKFIANTFSILPQYEPLMQLHLSTATKLLDVGCGSGYYIYPLYELGMKNVMGIDPFIKQPIPYPNGLQIQKKYVYEMEGKWDIIIYNHSFEHVPDPLENLETVSNLLSKDGICILRIPTVSSFAWEHYRTNWYQLDAPRHLFLHSIESIRLLASKANMELYDVRYDSSDIQFWGSERYVKDIPSHIKEPRSLATWIQRKQLKRTYKQKAKQLNQEKRGDQAAFMLRKNN